MRLNLDALALGRPRRCVITLAMALGIVISCGRSASVQEPKAGAPTIAKSSDLSAALPPGEWTRVGRSVDLGLAWLASRQAADGSFPSNPVGQPAVTSLAVMAFLSRGHLPGHGKYGQTLNRAIDFVLDQQSRRGYFSLLRVAPPQRHLEPPQTLIYNHCIAGLMLGEVYGMTSARGRGALSRPWPRRWPSAERCRHARRRIRPKQAAGGTLTRIVRPPTPICR